MSFYKNIQKFICYISLCLSMMFVATMACASVGKIVIYKMSPIADDAPALAPVEYFQTTSSLKQSLDNYSSQEVNCLAEVVYHEARSESTIGGKAVAEVVLNRVESRGFPKTICGVMNQRYNGKCQFSFVCNGQMQQPKNMALWQKSMTIAQEVLKNKSQDISGGALFFHALGYDPAWTKRLVKTAHIGSHRFYK